MGYDDLFVLACFWLIFDSLHAGALHGEILHGFVRLMSALPASEMEAPAVVKVWFSMRKVPERPSYVR